MTARDGAVRRGGLQIRTVEVRGRIDAPIEAVWDLVCDVESYPRFMPSVLSTRILAAGDTWTLTAWEVELKGSVLKWTEREMRHRDGYRIDYEQTDGDLEHFEGFWQLTRLGPATTEVVLLVQFSIGIPMLADMLNPVTERAIRDNSYRMLQSLGPVAGYGSVA